MSDPSTTLTTEESAHRARRRSPAALAVGSLGAIAAVLALCAPPASAVLTHEYLAAPSQALSEGVPQEGPRDEPAYVTSMTVDGGELYVGDGQQTQGVGEVARIDRFDDASGALALALPESPNPRSSTKGCRSATRPAKPNCTWRATKAHRRALWPS